MSFTTTSNRNAVLLTLIAIVIPLVTIIGLIVLIALHDVSAATGVSLIAVLAGVHGGAVVANASK